MKRLERTRIGIITPDDAVNDDEYWRYVRDDITLLVDRYRTPERFNPISPEMVATYGEVELLVDCAETLRITRPHAIAFFCNSCSFVRGAGTDLEICRNIQETAGVPATTISTAQIEALRVLGVRRVAVGAPYSSDVTACFHRFLEQHGIEVVSSRSLGLLAEWDIGNAAESVWSDLAETVDHIDAECILLACSGIRTATITAAVEARLRKPLVSAPAAGLWHALRLAGYTHPILNRGVLFERHLV